MKTTIKLVPVRNFAKVDETAYRSAQPMYSYEYKWLKKSLGLKTIINLRSELEHDSRMAPTHGINNITIKVKDHNAPTLEEVKDFIKIIKDEDNYPLLFHCEHGHGRTSSFSAIYSVIKKGLSLDDALQNEKHAYGYKFKHKSQLDFLKSIVWDDFK